jgi:small-conductance mechanosensitive channel
MPTWTAQTLLGMTIALVGGGLVIVASFLPWLRYPNVTVTGWDLVDVTRRGGGNPFLIMNAFADFDPMATGLTTVILGGLMALLAVVVLAAPKQPPPSRAWIPDEVILIMVLIMACAMLAAIFNVVSALSPNASSVGVEIDYGLFVLCAGVFVWLVGMLVEMSRPPSVSLGAGRSG